MGEHLSPGLDKQRRRESVQLDEDGEEFKEIQRLREQRWKAQDMRDGAETKEKDNGIETQKELGNLDDIWFDGGLSDIKGLSRLQTDPAEQVAPQQQVAKEELVAAVPDAASDLQQIDKLETMGVDGNEFENMTISRLQTDPAHSSLHDVNAIAPNTNENVFVSPKVQKLSSLDAVAFPDADEDASNDYSDDQLKSDENKNSTLQANVIANCDTTNLYFNV